MRNSANLLGLRSVLLLASLALSASAATIDVTQPPYNTPNNNTGNAATGINAAINAAGVGDTVYVPAGTYRLGGSIVPVDNTNLLLDSNAIMLRAWNGGNGSKGGAMINPNSTARADHVTVDGGQWTNSDTSSNQYDGRVINLLGDYWTVSNMTVTSWGTSALGCICFATFGSNLEIKNCNATGCPAAVGNAGVRVQYGSTVSVHDCYIESGDDTFCAFPCETNTEFGAGNGINGVTFQNDTGFSSQARFIACGETEHSSTSSTWNNVVVQNITFDTCSGYSQSTTAATPALFVTEQNSNSGAYVDSVKFTGCSVVPSSTALRGASVNAVTGASLTNLTIDTCGISSGTQECIRFSGVTTSGVRSIRTVLVNNCTLDGSLGTGIPVQIQNTDSFTLTNNTIKRPGGAGSGWNVTGSTGFTQSGNTLL